jgi:cellulose synthase operon protein C
MDRTTRAALIVAALLAPAAGRAGVAETFYLARGRANMEIRNYSAAVEAYRKALVADGGSREASRGVARALLANGETDLAVAELDRHLARWPDDWELAFEQARILSWSRYAYRAKDAARYLAMGLARHEDPARRRELARLLARDRATLDAALAEYDRLLAASPGDRALRDERLKLLLWDPARRAAAVDELRRRRAEAPADDAVARDLARLLAGETRTAAEAVELYAGLLGRRPDDAELRVGHARALVKAGRRAEARAAYDRAVALRPSADVRLERADLLAGDPSSRDAARADYEAVLRADPRSRRARLGLARVLGARKETSPDAIRVYQAVLADAPRDAEAHRGLARAYAWSGDADRALAHGDLAGRLGPSRPDVEAPTRDLRRGREPAGGGGARVLAQPGAAFGLSSVAGLARASAEPTPFTRSAVEAGFTSATGAAGARAEGAFVLGRAEWRPDPALQLEAEAGWDALRLGGRGFSGALRLERRGDAGALAIRLVRAARQDSFRAYAGEVVAGRVAGAASDTFVEVSATRAGEGLRTALAARAGAVSAAGSRSALLAGVSARTDREVADLGGLRVTVGVRADALHHARDLSGLGEATDTGAPRLFSPPLQASLSPRLGLARDDGLAGGFTLDAGPSLQGVGGPRHALRAGGDLRAALTRRVGDRLRLGADASAERLAAVYTRYAGGLSLEVLFP